MPISKPTWSEDEIKWRQETISRLHTGGASASTAQALERLGPEAHLVRVYLDVKARKILLEGAPFNGLTFREATETDVAALGAAAII